MGSIHGENYAKSAFHKEDNSRILPFCLGGEVGVCFLPPTMGNRSNKTSVWP